MSIDAGGNTPLFGDDVDLSKMDRGDAVGGEDPGKENTDAGLAKDSQDELSKGAGAGESKGDKQDDGKAGDKPGDKPEDERQRDDKGRFAKDDKDEPRIPKSRFDEQMARERNQREAAERRTQELEAQLAQNKTAEDLEQAKEHLNKLIKERNSFLADGDLDKAGAKDMEILEFQSEVAAKTARQQANVAKEQAKEEMRYDALVTKIEADYPVINQDDPDFDPEVMKDVLAVMAGYQQTQRLTPSQALTKAVTTVLGKPKAGASEKSEDKGEEVGLRRKQEAVQRNAKVADKQPPSLNKTGVDHDKVGGGIDAANVMKMTQDEFSKLSDDALSKMRGDYIS